MKKKYTLMIILLLVILVSILTWFIIRNNKKVINEKNNEEISLVEDDIYSYQSKVDDILKNEANNKNNTLKNPYIKVNPYKISPLTAIIIFYTDYETDITYTVNGEKYQIKDKSKEHTIPIYYLLSNSNNTIEIRTNKENASFKIKTDKLPEGYNKLNVSVNKNTTDKGKYFQISPDGVSNVAYNYDGDVVWYLEGQYYGDMQILNNGHFIVNNGISNNVMGQATGIVEMDLLGKIYKEYLIDGGVHHEVEELKNGDILVASSNPNSSRIFDYIYIIDKEGNTKKTIDLYEIVKKVDSEFALSLPETWAWMNSAYLNGDELIISLRHRSSVMSINYNTSEINWIFGKKSNWSSNFDKYLLNSLDNVYTQGQHTAYIEDGKLVVFDNGYSAELYEDSLCTDLVDNYSSVKVFNLNNGNINLDTEYKTDKRMFSYALSSVYTLDNGNKLINFGWEFPESSYQDELCSTLTNTNLSSRIVEVDKNYNIVFDGSSDSGKYRAYKYYFDNNKNYSIKNFISYNNYGDKYYKEMSNDSIDKIIGDYKKATISTDFYTGFMQVNALLDDNSELYFIFKSLEGNKNYKVVSKEKGNKRLILSFLPKLKGKYEVYYVLDNKVYKYDDVKEFK